MDVALLTVATPCPKEVDGAKVRFERIVNKDRFSLTECRDTPSKDVDGAGIGYAGVVVWICAGRWRHVHFSHNQGLSLAATTIQQQHRSVLALSECFQKMRLPRLCLPRY